ncbi:hypothetical protein C0416_02890 [bacterium]|nr:hypothetical protein [bacterium]
MLEENKNTKTDNLQGKKEESLMQNDELLIAPVGALLNKTDSDAETEATQILQNVQDAQNVLDSRVVAKPAAEDAEKDDGFFDVRLDALSESVTKQKEEKVIKSEVKPLQLFIFAGKKRGSFFESFVTTLSFVVFSAVIFAGSVFADISSYNLGKEFIHDGIMLVGEKSVSLDEEARVDTTGTSGAILIVGERGLIRLGADTVAVVESIDKESKTYGFRLEKGSLWGNTVFDESSFVVKTKYSNIYADSSSFSVVSDDLKTTIYSDLHDIEVDLLADNKVINKLWLAEGNQAQLIHSKLDSEKETIEKLLYSKLVKEFSYGRLSEKKKQEDPWFLDQLVKEISDYNSFKANYSQDINDKGLRTISIGSLRYQAKSILADMQSALTFNKNKKNQQIVSSLFENIEDAEYLFSQGNDVDGKVRLSIFNSDIQTVLSNGDDDIKNDLFNELNNKYYQLSLFVPGDELFPVKQLMFEKINDVSMAKFVDDDGRFLLLTAKLNDVYDAVKSSPVDLNGLFAEYFELYDKYTKSYEGKMSEIKDNIIHQNILVDNLLFQTPELYKLEFFDQKKGMEEDYLLALESSNDKKEQRQTFISNDIDLLSRIRYFLFNDKLDTVDARKIVYRLIQNIEDYQEGTVDIAAVNELFSKRLSDFGVFWEYLQAAEYSSTQLHGASHSERFEAFKEIQQEVLSFEDIREEILGSENVSDESVEEITAKALKDLEEAGIQDVEFGVYSDATKTRIPILSARTGGIEFRATYDWDRQLLSNIIVEDTIISQDGVKLLKASKFITETISSLSRAKEKEVAGTSPVKETDKLLDVKRAASVFLAEKFSKMGVVITMSNVEIVDLNAGYYKVTNVYFSDQKNAKFSFEYSTTDDKVSNLVVQTASGEKTVGDTFTPTFMKNLVLKIYDESN